MHRSTARKRESEKNLTCKLNTVPLEWRHHGFLPMAHLCNRVQKGQVATRKGYKLPQLLESGHKHQRHTSLQLRVGNQGLEQGRSPPCLQKVCWFQVLKTNPHGEVLLLKWQKDQQSGNTSRTSLNFAGCKDVTCLGRKQNLYSFLFTLSKVAPFLLQRLNSFRQVVIQALTCCAN